ncbi:MAG: phospholipid carrier-dependent glycosyltransferase [Microbacteriaceae bacterium]|nr:phospholipid carrier-dependent glycosyltransferase [Microbacteriaceae bacterium]
MTKADPDFDEMVSSPPTQGQPIGESHELTRLDAWWGAMLATPFRRRLWYWGGPALVTLLGAVLRLYHLGDPHVLVFDETFYVKDAWSLLHLGYEANWPADPDQAFNAGQVNGYETDGSYVAHPPLGKWMIAGGLAIFGAGNSVGWRISCVVVGILAIFVIAMITRTLTKSTLLATIAGGLFAIDGHAITLSRTALLDNFVMFFCLLGFWAILLDRGQSATRLALWMKRREFGNTDWGPALWWRPWLILAGLLFGAATAVKWSGIYFLAAFAVYTLVVDAIARRNAGVTFWISGTVFKQAPTTFLLTVPIALAVYLSSWTGWFLSSRGYYRLWANEEGNAITGTFAWIPRSVQSFWHYQSSVYDFHLNEHAPHAYAANPLGWLFLARPTAFYYQGQDFGKNGCTIAGGCAEYITSIPNPLIWFAAVAAMFYLIYRLVRRREWQVGLVLMGLVAGYLPWMLYTQRTVFEFYTIVFEPYLIIGLVFVVGLLLGKRHDPPWRRLSGIRLVVVFIGLSVLLSAFFYPVWIGMQVPTLFAQLHYWVPGWR